MIFEIEVSDFAGNFQLPQNSDNIDVIQSYIDNNQWDYLTKVLGADYGVVVKDYIINGTSGDDPLIDAIIDPFTMDSNCHYCGCGGVCSCNHVMISKGIKTMLLGFIYYEYSITEMVTQFGTGGAGRNKNEAATTDMIPPAQVYKRYNDAVDTARAIQSKVLENTDDYPTFKGQRFLYNYYL